MVLRALAYSAVSKIIYSYGLYLCDVFIVRGKLVGVTWSICRVINAAVRSVRESVYYNK